MALLLSALGCGGEAAKSGATASGKSYSNGNYGFSFIYSDPLKEVSLDTTAEEAGASFVVAFADPESGGRRDGTLSGVVVSVRGTSTEQPDASRMALMKAAWWANTGQVASRFGDFEVLEKDEITLNGVPALLYEGEGIMDGKLFHFKNVAVFVGGRCYELLGQCPADTWATTGIAVREVIDSFTLSDELKAIAVISAEAREASTASARSFVNSQYGFRLQVREGFVEVTGDVPPSMNQAQYEYAVMFADTTSISADPSSGGQMLTVLAVSVNPHGYKLSKSQANSMVHAMAASSDYRESLERTHDDRYSDLSVQSVKATRIGKRSAAQIDLTYTLSNTTRQRQRVYLFLTEKYAYQVQLETSQSVWEQRIGDLQKMADSFRIL